jgi:isoaspartyl peptidase/L-asparaginase-like protein (Ntn-hydrolase superfamily)
MDFGVQGSGQILQRSTPILLAQAVLEIADRIMHHGLDLQNLTRTMQRQGENKITKPLA